MSIRTSTKMSLALAFLLISIASTAFANNCDPAAFLKRWKHEQHSPCAHRTEVGVLIGFGYNLNLPHAKGDLAVLGIDRNDIPKGIITQEYTECDCEQNVCLTQEQSQWLFDISVDRARKQVSSLIKPASSLCCDIQNAFTALFFTFGTERPLTVPDFLFYASNKQWKKLGSTLLAQSWCMHSGRCKPLAERIMGGCTEDLGINLGCAPPTPKACDASGHYCCPANNTCCAQMQKRNIIFRSSRPNKRYWCCPLSGAVCCPNSCCPRAYPVCCGGTNSCCYVKYPVCCFPGTSQAYCCAASNPVCLGNRQCGSLDPIVEPVQGKVSKK